jgi:hypothetical protein
MHSEGNMSNSFSKLKDMLNQIVAEQINTLMFHLSTESVDKQKTVMTSVLEEILKMIHATRWHSITLVQLGNLFEMLQEDENVYLNDFIFNATNRLMFELGMVAETELSLNTTQLVNILADSVTSTRKKVVGNKPQLLAPIEYRDRGMSKEQWVAVMTNDPWVMLVLLMCYLNIDIQGMLPSPQKRNK